jgi:hypothetical protein
LAPFRLASGARQPNPLRMERPDQLGELCWMQKALTERIGVRIDDTVKDDHDSRHI